MRGAWIPVASILGFLLLLAWLAGGDPARDAITSRGDEAPGTEEGPVLEAGGRAGRVPADGNAPAPTRRGGCSISGTVLRGESPTAAVIEVRRDETTPADLRSELRPEGAASAPVATAAAEADGSFRVEGLATGRYGVRARAEDGALASQLAYCSTRRPHWRLTLSLRGGGEDLVARAAYADGRPFRGTVCTNVGDGRGAVWLPEVETDAEGRFHLRGLPRGSVGLSFVLRGGFRSSFYGVSVPLPEERTFVVDEGLRPHPGRVIDDVTEQPVEAARIDYSAYDRATGRSYVGTTETDERGAFELRMPTAESRLWVEKPGYEKLQAKTTEEGKTVLRLKRRGRLHGRVLRASDGAPVSGVSIHAWNWHSFGLERPLAVSAADGTYEAMVGPGRGMVYALGAGWVSEALPGVTDRSENPLTVPLAQGEEKAHDLPVVPTGVVTGVVLGIDHEPLAGVAVAAELPRTWQGFQHVFIHGDACGAVTDAEGRFRIEGLIPSFPYEIAAHPVQGLPGRSAPTPLEPGETREVEIRIPVERELTVRVVEKGTGRPVAGATVTAEQGGGHRASGTTDAGGTVRLAPLLPAPLHLRAYHADFLRSTNPGPFGGGGLSAPDPGPAPETLVLELVRGAFVAGVVLGVDGSPCVSGNLGIFPVGQKAGRGFGLAGLAVLEKGGAFRLGPVSRGRYDVVLLEETTGLNRRQISRWTVEAGTEDLVLRVDPSLAETDETVTYVSVSGPDGKPASAFIRVLGRHRVLANGPFLDKGRLEIRDLPEGTTIWVELTGPKGADGTPLSADVQGPFRIAPGTIDVRLEAAPTIEGVVRGPDGRPRVGILVRKLAVMPADLATAATTFAVSAVRTDAAGRFSLPGNAGAAHLAVEAPDDVALLPPLLVRGGASDVEIRLGAAATVDVTVQAADGAALAGAEVLVSLEGASTQRRATTDANGSARVRGLEAGRPHGLLVKPPAGRGELCEASRAAWPASATSITLPRGRRIEGTVERGATPAPYATVFWKDARGGWHETRADARGAFAVIAAKGPVVFVAAPNESSGREAGGPEVRVAAEAAIVHVPLK